MTFRHSDSTVDTNTTYFLLKTWYNIPQILKAHSMFIISGPCGVFTHSFTVSSVHCAQTTNHKFFRLG